MAVKTFTTETLTSADTNTYLANSGLVYVTSATIGTTVSTVTVSSAFNSTYNSYLVRMDDVTYSAANDSVSLQLRTGVSTSITSYFFALSYGSYTGVAGLASSATGSAFSALGRSLAAGDKVSLFFNVNQPYLANKTTVSSIVMGSDLAGVYGGYHNVNASYDQMVISTTGTMTGGTITVYGYRKA